jgi:DNA-binding response OmpR family regulator
VQHTVLVVEDEPAIRALIKACLAREPRLQVFLAEDGVEGVEMAQSVSPSLVFLDVRMPRMDGIEACRALRDHSGTRDARIVMLTAMGQDTDIERGYEAGADDYFLKPFAPQDLLDKARSVLGISAAA